MRTLIVGGARSGKSRYAEDGARASGLGVVYVATAQVALSEADPEMAARIASPRASSTRLGAHRGALGAHGDARPAGRALAVRDRRWQPQRTG